MATEPTVDDLTTELATVRTALAAVQSDITKLYAYNIGSGIGRAGRGVSQKVEAYRALREREQEILRMLGAKAVEVESVFDDPNL